MIKEELLAKRLDDLVQEAFAALEKSAALVRELEPEQGDTYASAVGAIYMCIYSHLLDPLYKEHPSIAPKLWEE